MDKFEFFEHIEEDEGFFERNRGAIIFHMILALFLVVGVYHWLVGVYNILF